MRRKSDGLNPILILARQFCDFARTNVPQADFVSFIVGHGQCVAIGRQGDSVVTIRLPCELPPRRLHGEIPPQDVSLEAGRNQRVLVRREAQQGNRPMMAIGGEAFASGFPIPETDAAVPEYGGRERFPIGREGQSPRPSGAGVPMPLG